MAAILIPLNAASQATDVDCSKCVNESDFAVAAITSRTIRNGTLQAEDIKSSAIVSNKIPNLTIIGADMANGTIEGNRIRDATIVNWDFAPNTITSSRLQNGTVTNVHFASHSIGGKKLAGAAVYLQTHVVNSDPADPVASCAVLRALLSTIDEANAVPTLIKLEAGDYNCSTGGIGNGVILKPFVDIEGSGQAVTIIRGDSSQDGNAVVRTAANSELRYLTVENTRDDATERHAIHAPAAARLTAVSLLTAAAGGAGVFNEAIECSNNASLILDNAELHAPGDAASEGCASSVYISSLIEAPDGMGDGSHICHTSFNHSYEPLANDCSALP